MSNDQKHALWIGAAIVGAVVLILLLKKSNNTTINNGASPNYTTYNLSPGSYSGTATGLPTIPAASTSDCGCGGGATGGFYTSLNDMLNSFMQGAQKAFQSYENNVYSAQTNFVTQYFNNPAGVATATSQSNIFAGA